MTVRGLPETMTVTQFDQVVAPLTRAAFLSDYWGKSFLRMAGHAGRFTALLTWDDLNRILEQHRLAPPRFRLAQDGRPLERGRYTVAGMDGAPRLDAGKLIACLAQGATMILDCVEEVVPRVRLLARDFQDTLHAGNYVNLYAGWHADNGFDLHWDCEDTVILQLSGRKRWQIYAPTRLHPLREDIPPPRPTGEPMWDGLLEDGDALYIPRGWWHIAYPVNEPSLHLTFATVPPHGMNLVQWVGEKLRQHAEIRRDLPAGSDAAGQKAYLARLRALIAEELHDTAIADFRREWEADFRPQTRIRLPEAPNAQNAPLTLETGIRLASSNRLSFQLRPGGQIADFRASGILWACPVQLIPALELLGDDAARSLSSLCEKLSNPAAINDLKTSLAALAKAGVVLLENL
jgi:ribosomal protein L16 Arg81 hydroxylase